MKKARAISSFRQQMSESMAEIRAIITARSSPTLDGRLKARSIEMVHSSIGDGKQVQNPKESGRPRPGTAGGRAGSSRKSR